MRNFLPFGEAEKDPTLTPYIRGNRRALVATGLAIILVLLLLYWFRGALLPFLLGAILAYILLPIVKALEGVLPWGERRPALRRTSAILILYAIALLSLGVALALLVPIIFQEVKDFIQSVPDLYSQARARLEGLNQDYVRTVPEEIRQRVDQALANAGNFLLGRWQGALTRTVTTLTNAFSLLIGLAILPVFLYYLLKDREGLLAGVSAALPGAIRPHALNVLAIANRVLGAYVRAQLLLGLVVGIVVFLGLFFLGIQFALLLGIIAGFTELIPIIGPWLGALAGILVTLATTPEKILWVVPLYIGVQVLQNTLLVPRIQGQALNIHPIVVMVVLIIGGQLAGLWGVILGPPLVATAIAVIKYFGQEWSRQMPPEGPKEPVGVVAAEDGPFPRD
jgi:predicted PurR-regulated permease PerM